MECCLARLRESEGGRGNVPLLPHLLSDHKGTCARAPCRTANDRCAYISERRGDLVAHPTNNLHRSSRAHDVGLQHRVHFVPFQIAVDEKAVFDVAPSDDAGSSRVAPQSRPMATSIHGGDNAARVCEDGVERVYVIDWNRRLACARGQVYAQTRSRMCRRLSAHVCRRRCIWAYTVRGPILSVRPIVEGVSAPPVYPARRAPEL